ncbi:transposase family protein [Saccharopolyspora hattusasensis]|uniref:transposase family protein n=1 Tax=Saccharopolyspora hattusasensis TaxID=1128679 RepID=UPI003D98F1FF
MDGLWQALEAVSDPRDGRGILYRLPLLLALAVLAVTAGAKTFIEIAEYAADLPAWFLRRARCVLVVGYPVGLDLRAGVDPSRPW